EREPPRASKRSWRELYLLTSSHREGDVGEKERERERESAEEYRRVRTRTSDVDETRQYGGSGSPELKYCFYGAWRTLKNSQSAVYTPSDSESDRVHHGVTPAVPSRDPPSSEKTGARDSARVGHPLSLTLSLRAGVKKRDYGHPKRTPEGRGQVLYSGDMGTEYSDPFLTYEGECLQLVFFY
ncbi:hypothetical protein NPIL_467021, partial [Nephila pilipes]